MADALDEYVRTRLYSSSDLNFSLRHYFPRVLLHPVPVLFLLLAPGNAYAVSTFDRQDEDELMMATSECLNGMCFLASK